MIPCASYSLVRYLLVDSKLICRLRWFLKLTVGSSSVCLGRQWNRRQGLVSGWAAAPAVLYSPILDRQALLPLLQMNSVLGSVGTDAALSCPRSFLSSHCSFLLSSHACLCNKPPVVSVGSYSSECAQISFANNFEAKVRPSCWSSSNGKLAVQYVLRNSSVLHAVYMAKPAQPSLNEQGEHAR